VRVVSFGKARGTVGLGRFGGWGTGWVRITPLAVLEETEQGRQRVAVSDATATAWWGILAAGAVVTLVAVAVRRLARRRRRK
jgi:hypothetical protein